MVNTILSFVSFGTFLLELLFNSDFLPLECYTVSRVDKYPKM